MAFDITIIQPYSSVPDIEDILLILLTAPKWKKILPRKFKESC